MAPGGCAGALHHTGVRMVDPEVVLTTVGMALVTVLTRGFFFISSKPWHLPHWAERGLQYAPIAALAAVVIPEIVATQGVLVSTWQDARLYAAVAGLLWFFGRGGVLGTILTGMAVYLPLHVGWGW
ncbi:MAG: hypothetical protein RL323_291 [Pseudomonadota bacterium]|jgi:branched-subunit amino acid transport protein